MIGDILCENVSIILNDDAETVFIVETCLHTMCVFRTDT